MGNDDSDVTKSGKRKMIYARVAATYKARSPAVESRVDGTTRHCDDAEMRYAGDCWWHQTTKTCKHAESASRRQLIS